MVGVAARYLPAPKITPGDVRDARTGAYREHRACKGEDRDAFWEVSEYPRLIEVCKRCPVRPSCMADVFLSQDDGGLWAGTSERQRRGMLALRDGVRAVASSQVPRTAQRVRTR